MPEYVTVNVYVEVIVKPQYLHFAERIHQVVNDFFSVYTNRFGGAIIYSELYGFIDRQDFVMGIRSLNMESRGNGVRRNAEGDILLSPNGIVGLNEVKCSFAMRG